MSSALLRIWMKRESLDRNTLFKDVNSLTTTWGNESLWRGIRHPEQAGRGERFSAENFLLTPGMRPPCPYPTWQTNRSSLTSHLSSRLSQPQALRGTRPRSAQNKPQTREYASCLCGLPSVMKPRGVVSVGTLCPRANLYVPWRKFWALSKGYDLKSWDQYSELTQPSKSPFRGAHKYLSIYSREVANWSYQ